MNPKCTLVTSIVLALASAGVAEAGGPCGMMGGGMGGKGCGMMGGGRGCCMMGGGMMTNMQSQQAAMMLAMQQQSAMMMAMQQQNALRAMQQNAAQQNVLHAVPQRQQPALRAVPQQRQQKVQPKAELKVVLAVDDAAATEQTAANALKFVRTLLEVGKTDKATLKLQELIKRYPETAAAEAARELLAKIDS
jgi:hypothetical protein